MPFQTGGLRRLCLCAFLSVTVIITGPTAGRAEDVPSIADSIDRTVTIHWMRYVSASSQLMERVCQFSVKFGSYSAGIDANVFGLVMHKATSDEAVSELFLFPWGREGERTLCINNLTDEDGQRLFYNVKRVIPEKGRHGPTTVHFGQESYGSR
ncbi:hypothetical protein [Labrenzia sp. VG12]|uniref:hypothetical protein n=1 Tax=Labrenzia sp. VG12 TaxID=2021862 RepID=UPI000B8C6089|nr:hypothetical protein [Labrenzia sp. VG12]ASP35693.1 hypothetical protein CHH27_22640 [Labrenzia sp. VG12]